MGSGGSFYKFKQLNDSCNRMTGSLIFIRISILSLIKRMFFVPRARFEVSDHNVFTDFYPLPVILLERFQRGD